MSENMRAETDILKELNATHKKAGGRQLGEHVGYAISVRLPKYVEGSAVRVHAVHVAGEDLVLAPPLGAEETSEMLRGVDSPEMRRAVSEAAVGTIPFAWDLEGAQIEEGTINAQDYMLVSPEPRKAKGVAPTVDLAAVIASAVKAALKSVKA